MDPTERKPTNLIEALDEEHRQKTSQDLAAKELDATQQMGKELVKQTLSGERNAKQADRASAAQLKVQTETVSAIRGVDASIRNSIKKLMDVLALQDQRQKIESLRYRYPKQEERTTGPYRTARMQPAPRQQKDVAGGSVFDDLLDFDWRKKKRGPSTGPRGSKRGIFSGAAKAAESILPKATTVAGGLRGASGAASAAESAVGVASKGLGGLARGVGSKLPVLGALVSGGLAIYDTAQKSEEQVQAEGGRAASLGRSLLDGATFGLGGQALDAVGNTETAQSFKKFIDDSPVLSTMTRTMKAVADTQANLIMAPFSAGARKELSDTLQAGLKSTKDVFGKLTDQLPSFSDALSGLKDGLRNLGATVIDKAKTVAGGAADWVGRKAEQLRDWGSKGTGVISKAAEVAGGYVANTATRASLATGKGAAAERRTAFVNEMQKQGITDPKQQAMMLAQVDHESGGFRRSEESFNYRSADRIMEVRGSARRKGKAAVEAAMAQGPEAVAELMYGGDKSLGNTEKGDGYKFRGRGNIQLTGRANYTAASKALGVDLVNNPELLNDPEISAKASMWYMQNRKGLMNDMKNGDIVASTKKINGGTNGLDDRQAKYNSYLASIEKGGLGQFASKDQSKIASADGKKPDDKKADRKKPDVKVADSKKPDVKADVVAKTETPVDAPKKKLEVVAQATPITPVSDSKKGPEVKASIEPAVTPVAPNTPKEVNTVTVANQPDLAALVAQTQAPARSSGSGGGHLPGIDDLPLAVNDMGLLIMNQMQV